MTSEFDDSGGRTPPLFLVENTGDSVSYSPEVNRGEKFVEGPDNHVEVGDKDYVRSASIAVPIFTQQDVHSEIGFIPSSTEEEVDIVGVEVVKDPIYDSRYNDLGLAHTTTETHPNVITQPRQEPVSNDVNTSWNPLLPASVGGAFPCTAEQGENIATANPHPNTTIPPNASIQTQSSNPVVSNSGPAKSTKDALDFLDVIKLRFNNQPEIFFSFLNIMKDFKYEAIDSRCVISQVNELFQGNPDLILRFNLFLPEGNEITTSRCNAPLAALSTSVIDEQSNNPVTTVFHYKQDQRFGTEKIVENSSCLVASHSEMFMNSNNFTATTSRVPYSVAENVSHVFPLVTETVPGSSVNQCQQNRCELQQDASALIGGQHMEYEQTINYVHRIKHRLNPEKYRQFLEILHAYQRQQTRPEASMNSAERRLSEHDIYVKMTNLFEGHFDLLEEFITYVPGVADVIGPLKTVKQLDIQPSVKDFITTNRSRILNESKQQGRDQSSRPQQQFLSSGKPEATTTDAKRKSTASFSGTKQKNKARSSFGQPQPKLNISNLSFEGFSTFLSQVRKSLSRSGYVELLRFLVLYNKEIFSHSELIQAVGDLLCKDSDRFLFTWFKKYISATDSKLPNSFAQPEITNMKEPSNEEVIELDPSTCRRLGQSYCQVPKKYQPPKCSGRTSLCNEVLNDEWLSVPVWTEVVTGTGVTKKLPYEELTYRTEDERFECDFILQTNAEAIMYLEIVNRKMSDMSTEEREAFRLDDCIGSRSTIHLRAIKRIYGDVAAVEIIEGLKRLPHLTVPRVLKRLKEKDEEWKNVQKEYNKIWKDRMQRYYLKSLDHQGSSFKQTDNKALRAKSLAAEIQEICQKCETPGVVMTMELISGRTEEEEGANNQEA